MNQAVLTGINAYPGCPLRGCLNDVMRLKAWLIEYGYFKENEIITLLDDDATAQNIKATLISAVAKVLAGERFLHTFSGHGTIMQVLGKAECAVCPIDFDFSIPRAITASDYDDIFHLLAPGVLANWLSDSCHSGFLAEENRDLVIPRCYPSFS